MSTLTTPESTVMWALRVGCKGPASLSQIIGATESGFKSDGYKAVVEKALAGLIELHLVEKLIIPGHKQFGPGRTLYSLTLRGYDWKEDEDHGTA